MKRSILFVGMLAPVAGPRQTSGQDDAVKNGTQRVMANQLFHQQASQKMGLLIPHYIYPADIHTNADYSHIVEYRNPNFEIRRLGVRGAALFSHGREEECESAERRRLRVQSYFERKLSTSSRPSGDT